jgi:hypothetical protein
MKLNTKTEFIEFFLDKYTLKIPLSLKLSSPVLIKEIIILITQENINSLELKLTTTQYNTHTKGSLILKMGIVSTLKTNPFLEAKYETKKPKKNRVLIDKKQHFYKLQDMQREKRKEKKRKCVPLEGFWGSQRFKILEGF